MIKVSGEFFSVKDTLECGQIFRFTEKEGKYFVISKDKACICYNEGDYAYVECEKQDEEYFWNFFDLDRDYSKIYEFAIAENIPFLTLSAKSGKGIRILNQDTEEMLFSFIVSQNNNIPRIKGILERLAINLGEKKNLFGVEFSAFPTATVMAKCDQNFYSSMGLGYRAGYIEKNAKAIASGFDLKKFNLLPTEDLKKELVKLYGVGPKVADCVTLFGFHRSDSFPVDTWIEKIYVENFNGKEKNRDKITEFFLNKFKENSGYVQQYIFNYKRNVEQNG